MLHGIDVSAYQSDLNMHTVQADFVIVKATGGPGPRYVNPYWQSQVTEATRAGKLTGLYHFSGDGWSGTSPETEALHFINTVKGYQAGRALVLDFEASVGNWPINDPSWALRWLRRVTAEFGRKPWVYCNGQAMGYNMSAIANEGYPLWHAFYSDRPVSGYNPDLQRPKANWFGQAPMWQFTQYGKVPGYGGHLDLNRFYGDANEWKQLSGLAVPRNLLIPGVADLYMD